MTVKRSQPKPGTSASAQLPRAVDSSSAPATAPQHEPPLARAGRVANMVSLDSVRFTHFSATSLDRPGGTAEKAEVDSRVGFTKPKIRREPEKFVISSTLVFSLHVRPSESQGQSEAPIANLRATIELAYSHKSGQQSITDEDLQEFANVNAPFNAWGYWREYVQSSLARLELPTARIPLFRVQTAQRIMLGDDE